MSSKYASIAYLEDMEDGKAACEAEAKILRTKKRTMDKKKKREELVHLEGGEDD